MFVEIARIEALEWLEIGKEIHRKVKSCSHSSPCCKRLRSSWPHHLHGKKPHKIQKNIGASKKITGQGVKGPARGCLHAIAKQKANLLFYAPKKTKKSSWSSPSFIWYCAPFSNFFEISFVIKLEYSFLFGTTSSGFRLPHCLQKENKPPTMDKMTGATIFRK